MSLIITFMFEPAKLQMNWARASGARNLRREAAEPAGPRSSVTGRLRLGDRARGEDQSEVAERLGEVAHLSPAPDVVLLGEQAEIVGQSGESLEEGSRLIDARV